MLLMRDVLPSGIVYHLRMPGDYPCVCLSPLSLSPLQVASFFLKFTTWCSMLASPASTWAAAQTQEPETEATPPAFPPSTL